LSFHFSSWHGAAPEGVHQAVEVDNADRRQAAGSGKAA